ncbi:MAG TPA: hypothetical protein VIL36_10265 [Acidimicrobiales bacterium]
MSGTGPVRWIRESDVVDAVGLPEAIAAVRAALADQAAGRAETMAKAHLAWGDGHTLHAIGAQSAGAGLVVTKTWAHTAGGATPLVVAWDRETGRLRAVIEAFALGQLRTAAVSAVATDLLAAPDAGRAAVLGAGRQALPQLAALVAVRDLDELVVWNRTPAAAEALAEKTAKAGIDVPVAVAATPAEAVAGAGVVTTVTRARGPLLAAADLDPGAHVNAVGAITPERRELDDDVAATARIVVADDPDSARRLAVELAGADPIVPLSAVAAGHHRRGPGRSVFKAMGIGLADLAVAAAVLEAVGGADAEASSDTGPAAVTIDHPSKQFPRLA